jgi:death-on-curing protein
MAIYFDIKYALKTQEIIIRESGGLAGVKNQGCLESVLENIQNDLYYPNLVDKITHLVHSTIKFHNFMMAIKDLQLHLGHFFLKLMVWIFALENFKMKWKISLSG